MKFLLVPTYHIFLFLNVFCREFVEESNHASMKVYEYLQVCVSFHTAIFAWLNQYIDGALKELVITTISLLGNFVTLIFGLGNINVEGSIERKLLSGCSIWTLIQSYTRQLLEWSSHLEYSQRRKPKGLPKPCEWTLRGVGYIYLLVRCFADQSWTGLARLVKYLTWDIELYIFLWLSGKASTVAHLLLMKNNSQLVNTIWTDIGGTLH